MNKLNHLLKNRIIPFILGGIVFTTAIALADTINSNEVLYDNSNSGAGSTDVQGVLDTLFTTVNHSGTGYSLLTHNPVGISSTLQGGLYRYQGTSVDNYICFGTTDKNTCTADTDKYMYRIIGIKDNGQLKLIKKEALNNSIQWSTASNVYLTWPNSNIYSAINGGSFLTNTSYVPNGWEQRISTESWKYGDIGDTPMNSTVSVLYAAENALLDNVDAKIGLIRPSDYFFGMPGDNACRKANKSYCYSGWITIEKNDSNPISSSESTMIRPHSSGVWGLRYDSFSPNGMTVEFSIRPVFYLSIGEVIASGSGTITDPYILGES